jgi:hypothetical protein
VVNIDSSRLIEPPVDLSEGKPDFFEEELGRRRDHGRGIHGARNRESMALIPIVSNSTRLTNR